MPKRLTKDPSIPEQAKAKFSAQKAQSRRRGIPFEMTLDEWWAWWKTGNRWDDRGPGFGLVMARLNDEGPYCLSNVYCATGVQNTLDFDQTKRWNRTRPSADTLHFLNQEWESDPPRPRNGGIKRTQL